MFLALVSAVATYPVTFSPHADRAEHPHQPLRTKIVHFADTLHFDEVLKDIKVPEAAPRGRGRESAAASKGTAVKEFVHQLVTDAPTLDMGSIGTLAT